jgi:hypothetical protein
VLLARFLPALTELLAQHNAQARRPALRLRLRAVVHAGEVHDDGKGFYGEDLDVAFRLLNSATVKRILRQTPASPLVAVVSEEIFCGIVRHRYFDGGQYQRRIQVRVAERLRRGWVHIPVPAGASSWPGRGAEARARNARGGR